MSSTKYMAILRAEFGFMLYASRQVVKRKAHNPILHRLSITSMTEADADPRLIDITGQNSVCTWSVRVYIGTRSPLITGGARKNQIMRDSTVMDPCQHHIYIFKYIF